MLFICILIYSRFQNEKHSAGSDQKLDDTVKRTEK